MSRRHAAGAAGTADQLGLLSDNTLDALTIKVDPEQPCFDCGTPTQPDSGRSEYYMVNNEVWEEAGGGDGIIWNDAGGGKRGYSLCVGCIERRLGRELCADDFADVPVNALCLHLDSPRLAERKRRGRTTRRG